jgi:hypothetical protein
MLGLGGNNPLPFELGGGDSTLETVHEALLDAYAPGWDIDGEKGQDAYAQALGVSMIWDAAERAANQGQPAKMLEMLTVWERATLSRPSVTDRDIDRRSALAAKLRGLAGNALTDIEESCQHLLGTTFVTVHTSDPSGEITYWPGQNPGPPGYEWSSNRMKLWIEVSQGPLSDADFYALMGELERQLDALCPSWLTFQWITGSGFLVGESLLGEMGL